MTATNLNRSALAPSVRYRVPGRGLGLALIPAAALLCVLFVAAGCGREPVAAPASRPADAPVVLILGGKPIRVEVVATDRSRQLGLMYRKSLAADAGMVFVFPYEQELAFWMKDTSIPLDIVYLDRDGKVVSVKQMAAFDTGRTPSDGPAKYAIELNRGMAGQLGIKAGDVIDLPPVVRSPPDLE